MKERQTTFWILHWMSQFMQIPYQKEESFPCWFFLTVGSSNPWKRSCNSPSTDLSKKMNLWSLPLMSTRMNLRVRLTDNAKSLILIHWVALNLSGCCLLLMTKNGSMNLCQEQEMAWSFLWISQMITGMFFSVVVMFPVPIHIAFHNCFKNDSMPLSFLLGMVLKVGSNWFNSSGSTTYCQKAKKDQSCVPT